MKQNFASNRTPRLRATSVGKRQLPRILTGNESLSHLYLSLAPKTMNSVLSVCFETSRPEYHSNMILGGQET